VSTLSSIPTTRPTGDRPAPTLDLPGWPVAGLAASFAACADITKAHARNFYYGLRLTPEPRRSAIFAIYAWMRTADDLADEPGEPALRREALQRFAAETERALAGDLSGLTHHPFWPAFAATMRHFPIEHAWIRDMLAGLTEDQQHTGYDDRDGLDRYCYRVASTVGLTCVAIWGLRPGADAEVANQRAIARGRAFQLTNILRDFTQDFDADPRRVYIPRADLSAHGLSAESLRAWEHPDRCLALMCEQIERARGFYAQSTGLEGMIRPECAPALWAMTQIYAALLERLAADPQRVIRGPRVRLSSGRKAWIALSAMIRSGRVGKTA
jgi:phytoene synthase